MINFSVIKLNDPDLADKEFKTAVLRKLKESIDRQFNKTQENNTFSVRCASRLSDSDCGNHCTRIILVYQHAKNYVKRQVSLAMEKPVLLPVVQSTFHDSI